MRTAYVYHPIYLEHVWPRHPESPERLERVVGLLEETGMLERLVAVEARPATEEEVALVHPPSYISLVRRIASQGGGHLDHDTYVAPRSYDAALMAAGGLLALVDALLDGEIDNGFGLIRPPGHHALPDRGMGFCLFNNVAIASRYAMASPQVRRVLIADFDVHHGNGTQAVFESDPDVLYISTHEYPFYPGTGHWSEAGRGAGRGTVLNVPLPAGVGDAGYMRVFDELVEPLARRFRPDLILVSAGYDAHWSDPLAMMQLSLAGYARIVRSLAGLAKELCNGHVLFTLEGGYHLDVLSYGILDTFHALLGEEEIDDPLGPAGGPEPDIEPLLTALKDLHRL